MGQLIQFADAQTMREFESAVGAMDFERVMSLWNENPGLQAKMLDMVENGKVKITRTPPEVA